MKNIKALLVLTAFLGTIVPTSQAAEDVQSALQKGLFEEEANHNLEAAIKAYQTVVTRTDEQRKFAATAVFRLGECYRKLGKTNEAAGHYSRLLRDFAEQTQLVKLSQDQLGNMGVKVATAGATNQPVRQATQPTATEDTEIMRLQAMLKDSPDLVNARNYNQGGTALHEASNNGQIKVVNFLLTNGANIHIKNYEQRTALLVASINGHKEVVELLVQHGADLNAGDKHGASAAHHAAYSGRKTLLEALIKAGANLEAIGNPFGQTSGTPLYIGVERGFHAVVELLVSKGANVNAKNPNGDTPLHLAARMGHVAIAETLLANKADVNAIDDVGVTPLHRAANGRHVATVELLLRHKADVNVYGQGGTPLLHAASVGAHEIAKLLLPAGADVNAQNERGFTALHFAAETQSLPLMKEVLRYKPDINLQMEDGLTALYKAVIAGRAELVKELLQAGANPNVTSERGHTPLHHAAEKRYTEIVALLLEHKADPNLVNQTGQTAFDLVKASPGLSSQVPHPGFAMPPRTIPARQTVNVPPPPLAPPTLQPSTPQRPAAKGSGDQVADLLLKHGADPDMQRRLSIAVIRNLATQTPQSIFFRGTNTVNRYTLFELIARLYGRSSGHAIVDQGFQFPDLSRITINRLKAVGKSEDIKLDVAAILRSADCSKDVWLEWGDIVHIPEQEHPLNTVWHGFEPALVSPLTNCLRRQVTVMVKGKADSLTLKVGADTRPPNLAVPAVFNFYLSDVLHGSGLLLTTSDRTRVKVTRKDPVTKKQLEMQFDITGRPGSSDLWLRDGDLIDVPDKGEAQKSAQAGED